MSAVGPLFGGLRFAHAISLGANCETAHQLRRLGRLSVHGLFDWLVTPITAVEAILCDDGARLARGFVATHAGTSVRCSAYNVLYHHEFPRAPEGEVGFDAECIARCRRKLTHKYATLVGACAPPGPVLFIRTGPESDLAWDEVTAPGDGDVRALEQALERRFPNLEFRLLVIDTAPRSRFTPPASGDRLEIVHAPRRRTQGWALDDGDWDAIAGRLRFASPATAAPPLEETLYSSGEASIPSASSPAGPGADSYDAAFKQAVELWRGGAAAPAAAMVDRLFADGYRAADFLEGYAALLTGEARFSEVLQRRDELLREGRTPTPRVELLAAHARLALAHDREEVLRAAAHREHSADWLTPEALMERLEAACRRGKPFSFVRLGDGEARFALATGLAQGPGLQPEDAAMLGEVVWRNWFGSPMSEADPRDLSRLGRAYCRAVTEADVLGVTDTERLARDTGHYGYLAAQETWVAETLRAPRRSGRLTSALNHFALDAASPHLERLLGGAPFVGVISPHPDLAERLAAKLSIPQSVDHPIPAEGRLPTAASTRLGGPHFPDRYEQLLETLRVPFRGAVFLVAAGLLGKVYCGRIKALGGVAIDIGSVADGWMGHDTRPGQMSLVKPLVVSPKNDNRRLTQPPVATPARLVACVSMHKTGSTALSDALRASCGGEVLQLHSTAPPQQPFNDGVSPTELNLCTLLRIRPATIVTCVRDPISQVLSAYFQVAEQRRHLELPEFALEPDALIAWAERMEVFEYIKSWMDANLRQSFEFDFRETPFSRETLSLRFESEHLRLLALRFEDGCPGKERALGWLLQKGTVRLSLRNLTAEKSLGQQYLALKAGFTAPEAWLDAAYDSDMIRHFYSKAERDQFRHRWSA